MEDIRSTRGSIVIYFLMFLIGVSAALVLGWGIYPSILYSEQSQPVEFNHPRHVEEYGADCEMCHFFREDGTYAGKPTLETCEMCHPLGESEAETHFIENYLEPGVEVPWVAYQKQPDNVFFSHSAHSRDRCGMCHAEVEEDMTFTCNQCHPDLARIADPPPALINRLNGYTRYTEQNLKMWQCERCHATHMHVGATINNACYVCHK